MPDRPSRRRGLLAALLAGGTVLVLLLGLVSWNLYRGVPLQQTLRMFADNSYALYLRNDGPDQVTVEVGFDPGPALLVPTGATVMVSAVGDESFPIRVIGSGPTTCFPVPFYQGAYPSKHVIAARSQATAAFCGR